MKTYYKNKIKYAVALSVAIIAVLVVSCNKHAPSSGERDISSTAKAVISEASKNAIYDLIQKDLTYEYTLLSTHNNQKENDRIIAEMKKNYAKQSVAEADILRTVDRKEGLYGHDFRYHDATGTLNKQHSTIQAEGDYYHVYIVATIYMPTGEISDDGEEIITQGGEDFDYTIIDSNGTYFIHAKHKREIGEKNIEPSNPVSFLPDPLGDNPGKKTRGSYSKVASVNFANSYYLTPPSSGYYNYTYSGGDCTNFLSHCLKTGGWSQVANWHWSSNGSSCNSMSCPRSPGWTGAYAFYQYITGVGSGRVIAQFADLVVPYSSSSTAFINSFKNTAYYLNKGDIIQMASTTNKSSVYHSTLVTDKQSSSLKVYVAYRSNGVTPVNHKYIGDLGSGAYLQGFKVKATY